jgi:hypothetical protein
LPKVQVRRNRAVLEGEHDLDQPSDASGGLEMPDVRFHGTDAANLVTCPAAQEDRPEGIHLDGIT